MTGGHLALEPVAQHGLGNCLQRLGATIIRLVDMQIDIQALLRGSPEERVELPDKLWPHPGDAAKQAAVLSDCCDEIGKEGAVCHGIQREEGDRLQRDPVLPGIPDFGKNLEGYAMLGRKQIQVRTDQAGAMGVGGAEREFHAPFDVCG